MLDALRLLMGIAGVLAAAAGAVLLFAPSRVLQQPSALRRLLFETNVDAVFDRRFVIERRVYRRHRIVGILVLAGAFALALLLWHLSQRANFPTSLAKSIGFRGVRALGMVMAALSLCLAVFGGCLLIRPSVLKGVEAAANRWIHPVQRTGNSGMAVKRVVLGAPRMCGLALVLLGIYCVRPF